MGMKRTLSALSCALLATLFISPIPAQAVSANPSPICIGSTCTVSFGFIGDYYSWTAPSTGNYILEVWGAQGGSAGYNGSILTNGAKGGYAKGTAAITAGQVLNIYVGGQGAGETSTSTSAFLSGGFNGGGTGFNGPSTSNNRGAGGGGGSDIRLGGNALTDRIIVAGGGGGGVYYTGYGTNYPGYGGGTSGGDGYTSGFSVASGWSGKGGTQSAGGASGTANGGANPGTLGQGGASTNNSIGGGGGGGGYYGGGASSGGMASGGGSGYVGGVTSSTLTAGNATMPNPSGGTMTGRSGNGYVIITYTAGTATISISVAGGATKAFKGQSIAISATVDYAGQVTFYADGKRIAGCISLSATVGNVTCNWKPPVQKSVRLTAIIIPSGASAATSAVYSIGIVKRSNTR